MNIFGFDVLDFYLYLLHVRVQSKRFNNRRNIRLLKMIVKKKTNNKWSTKNYFNIWNK